jgi:hypothetical protein
MTSLTLDPTRSGHGLIARAEIEAPRSAAYWLVRPVLAVLLIAVIVTALEVGSYGAVPPCAGESGTPVTSGDCLRAESPVSPNKAGVPWNSESTPSASTPTIRPPAG